MRGGESESDESTICSLCDPRGSVLGATILIISLLLKFGDPHSERCLQMFQERIKTGFMKKSPYQAHPSRPALEVERVLCNALKNRSTSAMSIVVNHLQQVDDLNRDVSCPDYISQFIAKWVSERDV